MNRVKISGLIKSHGIPIMDISLNAKMSIGHHFVINNGLLNNMIGRQQPCFFVVSKSGTLTIGNHVGISGTAIVCWNKITIEDNVKIGGGVVIYDTDFHSLDYRERTAIPEKFTNVKTNPVLIKKNAFIGAHTTILKGVTIGNNSIIGAGSVVTRNIPDNEIWAGNPARFVRRVE
jgi:acetyltransferase-like isoleucine patch superfamily enzyme